MRKLKSLSSFEKEGLLLSDTEMTNVSGSWNDGPTHQSGYFETCNNNVEDCQCMDRYDNSMSSPWGAWKLNVIVQATVLSVIDGSCCP
jgi:hypothetical protein